MPSRGVLTSSPSMALIGCGAIAEHYYLPALTRHPPVMRHLILVDPSEQRAREMAVQFGAARHVRDYHEVLETIDGAIVAVPTRLHFPISTDLLSRGVHVLCEKPLAESADNARQMVQLAQETGAVLAANYQLRLYPNLAKVKELLASGVLGKPVSIRYRVGSKFDWPSVSGFYFDSSLSCGGVLRDLGAHVLDVVCWWLDTKPMLVSSQNDSFGGNEAVARVCFKHNGCRGEVELSWLAKLPGRFVVEFEAGVIRGDVYDFRGFTLSTRSGGERRVRVRSGPMSYSAMAHAIVTNFLNVVEGNERPIASGQAVLNSIEFIDECYRAASRFDMPWYDVLER